MANRATADGHSSSRCILLGCIAAVMMVRDPVGDTKLCLKGFGTVVQGGVAPELHWIPDSLVDSMQLFSQLEFTK